MTSESVIESVTESGICTLAIDRPLRKNALRLEDWEMLAALIDEARDDDAVRAIILTGKQPNLFCAGADIADIAANHRDADWRARKYAAVRACNRGLWLCDKPVVAAIDGDCIGGGCGLALSCDLRIAGAQARFGVTPAKLGIAYARFDTALLVAAVGDAEARRLLLTAELIGAENAHRIGLIHEIASDPQARAKTLAHRMLALSPHSIAVSKQHLRAISEGAADDDETSRNLFVDSYTRPGFAERLAAFLQRKR